MKKNNEPIVYRGEVYYADLSPAFGSEQGGLRPVIILQNNIGNKHSPTTIIAPITSNIGKKPLPTHILIPENSCGLSTESIVLTEQIRVIDKQRLKTKIGVIPQNFIVEIDKAIKISLAISQRECRLCTNIDDPRAFRRQTSKSYKKVFKKC